MSDSQPDASSPLSWEEAHKQTVAYVDQAKEQLDELCADDRLEPSAKRLALHLGKSLVFQQMTLLQVGVLERRLVETKALLRDFMEATMELVGIEDEIREHLEERLDQVEYATVAEGQQERLVEQLAGDVLDVIADKMKGEDASEGDS